MDMAMGDTNSAFSSLESLADIASCPVHMGRLQRPKLMPCGHVFCLSCLDKWSERQGGQMIECPMCRRRVARPELGATGLPNAMAHQAILDYMVTHASRQQHKSQQQQQQDHPRMMKRKRSLEMRQDLLAQISDDLVRRADTSEPGEFDRQELVGVRDNLSRVLQRLEAACVGPRPEPPPPPPQGTDGVGGRGETAIEADDDTDDAEEEEEEPGDEDEDEDDDHGGESTTAEGSGTTGGDASAAISADDFSSTQREMHRLSRYRVRELPVPWGDVTDDDDDANTDDQDDDYDSNFDDNEGIAGAGMLRRQGGSRARRSAPMLFLLGEGSRELLVQHRCGGHHHQRRRRRQSSGSQNRSRSSRRSCLARVSVEQLLTAGGEVGRQTSGRQRLRVTSIQAARGAIYLTGSVGRRSILAIVSPEGGGPGATVLRCHTREESTEEAAVEGFAGFHVEPLGSTGTVVAAQPGLQRVEFFGEDLHPTGHWLVFDRLQPRHVAWARQSKTLWVSCPNQRLVLAVNDSTGVYRKLSTGDIFQSPPSHIVATISPDGDCRVVLADAEQGRLFWIRKRRKYIFLQRLQLPMDLPSITSLSAQEGGRLLVTSRDRLFRLKPAIVGGNGGNGGTGGGQRQGLKCQLL